MTQRRCDHMVESAHWSAYAENAKEVGQAERTEEGKAEIRATL
jgi:hypothetical protein